MSRVANASSTTVVTYAMAMAMENVPMLGVEK
jgi:hypothetical protein